MRDSQSTKWHELLFKRMEKQSFLPLLVRSILLLLLLLLASTTFSQVRSTVSTPYVQNSLVTITEHQYDIVLFSFSYIKGLEKKEENYKLDIVNLEKQITVKDSVIVLRDMQLAESDTIQELFLTIGKKKDKEIKKQKRTRNWAIGGLSALIAALIIERGVHTYQDLTK